MFPAAGDDRSAEPFFDRLAAFKQSPHLVAHDLAVRRISVGLDFVLDGLGHIERKRLANSK